MKEKRSVSLIEPFIFTFFGILLTSCLRAFGNKKTFAALLQSHLRHPRIFTWAVVGASALLGLCGLWLWFKYLGHGSFWWRKLYLPTGIIAVTNAVCLILKVWWWDAVLLLLLDPYNKGWTIIWASLSIVGILYLLLAAYLFFYWNKHRAKRTAYPQQQAPPY